MDLLTFRDLLTPDGQAVLAAAEGLRPSDDTFLTCFERLCKSYPRELARAALETVLLRRRAAAKFALADRMYFVREALEQASSEVVARHRSRRFAHLERVGDFCCGLGGDTIGLSEVTHVVAVERDPLRLALAEQNLAVHGRQADFLQADLLQLPLPDVAGIFFDPGRRPGGRRQLAADLYEPPLAVVHQWRERIPSIGVKLAPGIDRAELTDFEGETEFLSVAGELKECVLWLGPLRSSQVRATVLPGGGSLFSDIAPPLPRTGAVGRHLYEPDPAVIRAGLVTLLARRLDAHQLDASIAYLTADHLTATPFAQGYVIEATLPFQLKRLRDCLRSLDVGRLVVKRRGSPVEPDDLVRRLKLRGTQERTLFLTRCLGEPVALVGTRAPRPS